MKAKQDGDYSDIIDLPHHVSSTHPHMSLIDRAAQFAPFAALTGYGEAIDETARRTEMKRELDENSKEELDEELSRIAASLSQKQQPVIEVTYFVPDERKLGGRYETEEKTLKKIDTYEAALVMTDGERINLSDIFHIQRRRSD